MRIHQDGIGTILFIWLICSVLIFLTFRYLKDVKWAFYICVTFLTFLVCLLPFFFRVPRREIVDGDELVTSVADGKVVIVEKVYEPEYLKCECIQVSVFMSIFNVHVNYWPTSGDVTYYKYHPGKYLLAFLPKASELNEHTSMAIRNQYGEVFFKQIAGTIARRIVCYAKKGIKEKKGKQCGLIKLGSRIDMFLPLTADIKVKVGDRARACETVIAVL